MEGGTDVQLQSEAEQNSAAAGSIDYEVLEMAAFHNNQTLLLDWLESCKGQQDYGWRGNLLSRAAYYHSVDVVRCILSFGDCDG